MMGWGCPGCGLGGSWGSIGLLGMLPGLLIFFGILALLVIATIWFLRRFRYSRISTETSDDRSDPLQIAKQRLAAGEITTAAYEEIRDRIHS